MKTKMDKLFLNAFLGMTFLASTQIALAQDSEAVARGKAKFDHSCAPCHGKGAGDDGREMLPGTYSLKIKYGDTLPAALEDRTDLTSEVISVFVRMRAWSMPPFRKTELSDKEIDDIAAYFNVSSRAGNQEESVLR